MDEQINKLARLLKREYSLFILIPVLLVFAFESGWLTEGYYAGDPRMQYILGTSGILLALIFVPLSLKLFNIKLTNKIKQAPIEQALKLYKTYSQIRIGMLAVVVLINIVFYYLTLQNTGAFCAVIGLVASIFCLPGENRVRQDLDLIK